MALIVNEKQPYLEPAVSDEKNTLSTIFLFLGVIVWCLGGVVTVFAILGKLGVGTFSDMFSSTFPDGIMIPHIIGIGVSVFFSGLMLITVSELLKYLKKASSTVYIIRGLEQIIPSKVELAGVDPEAFAAAREAEGSENQEAPENKGAAAGGRQLDASGIQITVNVNPPAGSSAPVPVTVTATAPEEIPETVPRKTAEAVPETTAVKEPQAVPEAAAEKAPEAVPETAAQTAPQAVPETTAVKEPQAVPETAAEKAPEAVPETTAEKAPEAVPETTAEEAPETVSEGKSETEQEEITGKPQVEKKKFRKKIRNRQ